MLLLFADGLGWSKDPKSPLQLTELKPLRQWLAGRGGSLGGQLLDATLGVRGLPQSATGQTSLLTGINAAKQLGRHHGPHPGPSLLPLLATQSLHTQIARAGRSYWHANGYSVHFCGCSNVQDTGHRSPEKVPEALLRLWRLIESLRQYSLGLALISDHGNAEENWHPAHTENPVPLVVSGPLTTKLRPLRNPADFSPWLLEAGGLLE